MLTVCVVAVAVVLVAAATVGVLIWPEVCAELRRQRIEQTRIETQARLDELVRYTKKCMRKIERAERRAREGGVQ